MDNQQELRVYVFFIGLLGFSLIEFFTSYRSRELKRFKRWPHSFLIIFLSSIPSKVLLPSGLAFVSIYSQTNNYGLFNILDLNFLTDLFLSILLLDMAIYWQHLFFHKNQFLWRFHRVHHSDIDLDTTSALRFHPIEIAISLVYKGLLIMLLGLSIESIFLFEVVLNFMAMFNHSNITIPPKLEKVIRILFVTPQMHIIHHSIERFESDTNYGFNFSIWDKVFKTYSDKFSSKGIIGNKRFRTEKEHHIIKLLTQPFR